jgi:phage baseplate assembly protein W
MSDPRTNRIGRGLLRPFRRGHDDFVNGTGAELLKSNARNILGTRQGELRHRGDFGSRLHLMLHSAPRGLEGDVGTIYAAMDIARWEPRITVRTERSTSERNYQSTPGLYLLRIAIKPTDDPGNVHTGEFEGAYHEVIA